MSGDARRRPADRPRPRVLRALLAIAVLDGLCLAAGRWSSAGPHPAAVIGASLAAIAYTVASASLLEWLVHRFVYHRRLLRLLEPIYRVHHAGHHHVYFPPSRYAASGPPRRFSLSESRTHAVHESALTSRLKGLLHFASYMTIGAILIWSPAWLVTRSVPFVAACAAASAAISYLFIAVHDAIHHPGQHPLIEKQPWFELLNRHHFIHHLDTELNVNFLLPLTDALAGTMRLHMTAAELLEFGSARENRERPIGLDEPAAEALRRARRAAPHPGDVVRSAP